MSSESNENSQIQACLTEYEKLRDEELHYISTQTQIVILGIGSVSVIIPVLVTQSASFSLPGLVVTLYALTIFFSAVALIFAKASHGVAQISFYINNYIEPQINRLAKTSTSRKIFQWESFNRKERQNFLDLVLSISGNLGITLLILLPSTASLVAAHHVYQLTLPLSPSAGNPNLVLLSSWLLPLSIVTWGIYAIAIVSVLFVTAYWFWRGMPRTNKRK